MELTKITPITQLRVLKNVHLDNKYEHTYTFNSENEQQNFFLSKTKYLYTDLTPISVNNQIRLPIVSDNLYDCNYIMYQNANFGNKWFYAFITDIQFININMTIINVEIDVIQTWYFDYTLLPSFVVREHTNNDTIGANLVPENLYKGDYYDYNVTYNNDITLNTLAIVVAASVDFAGEHVSGAMYSNIYSGVTYNVFTNATDVNNWLDSILTKDPNNIDAILAIFMMPLYFAQTIGTATADLPRSMDWNVLIDYAEGSNIFEGYYPKNKKLFTSPYAFIEISNNQGNTAIFKNEYIKNGVLNFKLYCTVTPNPTLTCIPQNYNSPDYNDIRSNRYDYQLTLSNFPQCSYNIDAFKAYIAQMSVSGVLNKAENILTPIYKNPTSTSSVIHGAIATAGWIGDIENAYNNPPQIKGNISTDVNSIDGGKTFYAVYKCIHYQFAKRIDDYFDMYGYATNEIKIPNITGRPFWNYVQTADVNLIGSIPFNDISKIKDIYNRGITFWHGDYIGDYSRYNHNEPPPQPIEPVTPPIVDNSIIGDYIVNGFYSDEIKGKYTLEE